MVVTKKIQIINFVYPLIFTYLLMFPLGQLLRTESSIMGKFLVIQPIEVVIFPLTVLVLWDYKNFIRRFPHFVTFVCVLLFSLLLAFSNHGFSYILIGMFYLMRVINFVGVFYGAYLLRKKYGKRLLTISLIMIGLTILTVGMFQYLFHPDLRDLRYLGWDDHAFRLGGTFFDPGFTGILLTLAALLSTERLLKKRNLLNLLLAGVFILGTLLTYSRSSYLALIFGMVIILVSNKFSLKKLVFLGLPLFLGILLLLPRPGGEGIRLERTASIVARFENYDDTINIWKTSPVFGIGFNNLCTHRLSQDPTIFIRSHSCSGSDSSLMMLIATSGIVGAFSFINLIYSSAKKLGSLENNILIFSSFTAILVHSLFTNSLFYPWTVGWFAFVVIKSAPKEYFKGNNLR